MCQILILSLSVEDGQNMSINAQISKILSKVIAFYKITMV